MPPPSSIPSPWKTLRRTLLHLLLALLLLTLLWSAWYAYAAHKLHARLAAYRAKGEPTTSLELFPSLLPGADNAYDHLAAAAASVSQYSPTPLTLAEHKIVSSYDRRRLVNYPQTPADPATVDAMLASRPTIPVLLERARISTVTIWPDPTISRFPSSFTEPKLGDVRRLAMYERIAALHHHHRHEDARAFVVVREMNTIAITTLHGRLLANHLLALDTYSCMARTLFQIAPDLEIQTDVTPQGVPREEVLSLIRALLDDNFLNDQFRQCMFSERVLELEELRAISDRTTILLPIAQIKTLPALDACDSILQGLGPSASNYREICDRLPEDLHYSKSILRRSNEFYELDFAPYYTVKDTVGIQFAALMYRRAAALRLAIRLFELDHLNQIPPDLKALVPTYMPALPDDPFRSPPQPFVYAPSGRRFYSVSFDGKDNGGPLLHVSHIAAFEQDCVFPLDRSPPIDRR